MASEVVRSAGRRVLVVEDELMIRMLLGDMLEDLGYTVAAEAARVEDAVEIARNGDFDIAILDVNLNGQSISPVVEALLARGLPFVFSTGYGQHGVPAPYRRHPTLQKPFQLDALGKALANAVPKS